MSILVPGSTIILINMAEGGVLQVIRGDRFKINDYYRFKYKELKNLCLEPDTLNHGDPIRLRECIDGNVVVLCIVLYIVHYCTIVVSLIDDHRHIIIVSFYYINTIHCINFVVYSIINTT